MRGLLIVAAVLVPTSQSQAEPPVVRISQDQQRQVCNQGQCRIETSTVWGSGTIIGRDANQRVVVLTCGHGWKSGNADIWFGPGDHRPGVVRAVRTDRDVDLGVLTFTHKGDIASCTLAEKAPSKGEALTAGGWGAGKLNLACVDCEGYIGRATIVTSGTFRQGDSGGPVIWNNHLVGIVNGNMDGRGVATSSKACREFVRTIIGMVPGPAEESDAPPVPGPPPEKLAPQPITSPEFSVIMRRLDLIEKKLDLLSPKVKP